MKNKKYLYLLLIIIPIIIFFVGRSFSLEYTQEIKRVEIESEDYDNPGSWHIDKSAEWIGSNKARVTFDVSSVIKTVEGRNKDVILVIDVSGSMNGNKLDKVKEDSSSLINYLLSDNNNRVALITFDSDSTILSGFTNNKTALLDYIDDLVANQSTNYNAGLLNVYEIMKTYTRESNRDLTTLFLTDGYPNEDTPSEKATYRMLKDKYPYMLINGIQYEMGDEIIQDIVDVSDNQWIARMETLNNILFEAAIAPIIYDNFVITDYINDEYFYLNSIDDIRVSFGDVSLNVENGIQKVTWNLGNNYRTGSNIQMTIDLDLKEAYHDTKGFYPTNNGETIVSKLPEEDAYINNSNLTPVLMNYHYVYYDTNKPEGCTLSNYDPEEHYVYQTVEMKTDSLVCPGYLFKGWVIDKNESKKLQMVNDEMFIMPSQDVTIRATWSKEDLVKEMDGTVHTKLTLYKVLQSEANARTYASKYTGSHQDSYNNNGTKDIYYYDAENSNESKVINEEKNNVLFANHCWKMFRTTDTGGVKLIYNGEPEDNKCLNTRGTHEGYSGNGKQDLSGNYYYGSSYIYDSVNKNFKIDGTKEQVEITTENASSVIPSLAGKYTCKKTDSNETCTTIYWVDEYSSVTSASVYQISNSSHYSQFGTLKYNVEADSMAYVGYMYNMVYSRINNSASEIIYTNVYEIPGGYYYSDRVDYNNLNENKYTLIDPHLVSELDDINDLVGKYVIPNYSNVPYDSVYYIVRKNSSTSFLYIKLQNGDLSVSVTIGDSFEENLDGTYTIKNSDNTTPQTITYAEWAEKGNAGFPITEFEKKYMCIGENPTCNKIRVLTEVYGTSYYYIESNKIKYGEDIEYIDGNYRLKGDIQTIWDITNTSEQAKLKTHHYTCLSNDIDCDSVYYLYYFELSLSPLYVRLTDGKNITEAVYDMLHRYDNENVSNNVNKKDSTIKKGIDEWFKNHISDYSDYLEDTVFCNSRNQTNNSFDLTGAINKTMTFKESGLSCVNETDRFSTLNDKAKLKYKVGLPTYYEMFMSEDEDIRKTSKDYWTMTPSQFDNSGVMKIVKYNGNYPNCTYQRTDYKCEKVDNSYGVRPVVSLVPDIEYLYGDGSMENPYQIDDGTH